MSKIHLALPYKTDSLFKILLRNNEGVVQTGATGTYIVEDIDGGTVQSGSMSELSAGYYYFAIPDDISVSPGDILTAKVTMLKGGYQCYGEYELFVEVDRR